jgi:hypothetical protein
MEKKNGALFFAKASLRTGGTRHAVGSLDGPSMKPMVDVVLAPVRERRTSTGLLAMQSCSRSRAHPDAFVSHLRSSA